MPSLVTLDYAEVVLGISSPTAAERARLQTIIDGCSAAIIETIGRDIVQTTYPSAPQYGKGDSGFYCGNGTRYLDLRQRPVIESGLAVYLDATGRFGNNPDGSFAASTLLTYGTDYILHLDGCLPNSSTKCSYVGRLERLNGVWPERYGYIPGRLTPQRIPGVGNIKVAYTAGYTLPTVPNDIKMAVCHLVGYTRRTITQGGPIQSESWEDYSYSLAQVAITGAYPEIGSLNGLLARWREVVV